MADQPTDDPTTGMPAHCKAVYTAAYAKAHADAEGTDEERAAAAKKIGLAAIHKVGYHRNPEGKWTRESNAGEDVEEVEIDEADLKAWRADARRELAVGKVRGAFAGPDGSFPIADESDVGDAWGLAGKAADPEGVRRKIIIIAKKYGWTAGLPETAKVWAAEHNIELAEPNFIAADAEHLVTLHALAEADVAEGSGERISTVEVAQVGSYIDAHGKSVDITEDSIDRMVANFEAQAAGQAVPVDVMHEKREATGWLKRVWRDGSKLLAEVSWNNMGTRLVSDKIYRYLSASIAMPTWVLRSVSLVNFPAIKGLAPVELSEWLLSQPYPNLSQPVSQGASRGPQRAEHSMSAAGSATRRAAMQRQGTTGGKHMDDTLQNEQEPTSQPSNDADLAEFNLALQKAKDDAVKSLSEQIVAELAEKREQMLSDLRQEMTDERELSEFVLAATATGSHALPVKPDELKTVLKELPKPQRTKVMALLTNIAQAGTVDLGERGTSAAKEDRRRLDASLSTMLRQQMASGMTVETFFAANPDLGGMADYDLTEFGK